MTAFKGQSRLLQLPPKGFGRVNDPESAKAGLANKVPATKRGMLKRRRFIMLFIISDYFAWKAPVGQKLRGRFSPA